MKDPNASALGKKGGKKKTPAKAQAARLNATQPPKPGKRARGRPFEEPAIARIFCENSIFDFKDLDTGKIVVMFSRERFNAALAAMQSQGDVAVAMREFKPEVDLIMGYVRSGKTTKTIPELTTADLERLRFRSPKEKAEALASLREAPGTIRPGVSASRAGIAPAECNPTITTFRNRRVGMKGTPANAQAARQNASKPPKPEKPGPRPPISEATRAAWLAISTFIEDRFHEGCFSITDATVACQTISVAEKEVRANPSSAHQVATDIGTAIIGLVSACEDGEDVLNTFDRKRLYVLIERFLAAGVIRPPANRR